MKIALLVDYYPPFNPGGSEWSTFYLASSLKGKGIDSIVVTPNYGALPQEVLDGVSVIRFKTPFKVKNNRSVINPVFQNNPIFFISSFYKITKIIFREKAQILHVNGKFLIPGGFLAAWFLRKPFVVSIRDKQLLCSYGKCFFEKERYKSCGWMEYMTSDMPWFFENYVKEKNTKSFVYTILAAIWTRMMNSVIAWFAKRADKVIAISKSQKEYLEKNGFKNVEVIYNSMEFTDGEYKKERRGVLYAGKLSLGKGVYQLFEAIPEVLKFQKVQFIFAGGIDEKEKIMKLLHFKKIEKNVKLLGGVDHFRLQKLYSSAKLVVMPSIFPEAFGRVALEALASGTPVVVSDRGGLPEIVENGKTGIVSSAEGASLAKAIKTILKNEKKYLKNVSQAKGLLKRKFGSLPIEKHIRIYKELVG